MYHKKIKSVEGAWFMIKTKENTIPLKRQGLIIKENKKED